MLTFALQDNEDMQACFDTADTIRNNVVIIYTFTF